MGYNSTLTVQDNPTISKIYWARNYIEGNYKIIKFQEVFDSVPENIKEKLIFYLDIFRK